MSGNSLHKRKMGRKSLPIPIIKEEKDPTRSFNTAIEVGAEFDSFDGLDLAIRAYEAENFVNLIVRDTRKIESAVKRNRRKSYNPSIKYSDVCYCCTYGGKKFKSRSTGKRIHKTTKKACPFNLKVRATPDGQRLFIREMCAKHNHEFDEADFRLHPKQRKLDHVSQVEIATLLSLEPDKKLLREKLMQVTGKVILMKDIQNIKTRLLSSRVKGQYEIIHDIGDFTTVTSSHSAGKDVHSSPMPVGGLVDNPTVAETETGQAVHELRAGKELQADPLSIHVPVSQIVPGELASVLNTIVTSTSTAGNVTQPQQGNQTQNVSASINSGDIPAVEGFSHSSNIFPCSLDSFSHQPHQMYQVSIQPMLTVTDVAPVVSPVILHEHANGENGHQSFNPLEDVNNIGMNILHSLQPWQEIDSHSSERNSIQSVVSIPHENTSVVNSSNFSLASESASKIAMEPSRSITNRTLDIPDPSHTISQRQQSIRESKRQKGCTSLQRHKKRRNQIEVDKEEIKKKYFQQATVNLFFNERFSFHGNKPKKDRLLVSATSTRAMSDSTNNFHEMLKPLSWLFGTWKGDQGKAFYPTMTDFTYSEMAEFHPVHLKPMVEYKFYSSTPDGTVPLHRETGFIRIKPNSNNIAFVASHNLGIAEVQEGEVKVNELTVETTELARVSFNIPPVVKKVRRTLKRTGDNLEQVMDMETDNTPMTEHLRITFKKIDP